MTMRIGIDLGGTKIEGIALAPDGTIPVRRRVPTPNDYPSTLDALVGVVETIEREVSTRCTVGIGIPGTVMPETGVVKNANSVCLNGETLLDDLNTRLGRTVRLMNDANCFALSEAADGAAAGAPVVFGVILGTGVGGGIVVDGKCLIGVNQITGEWGHNPLPWPSIEEIPGPSCYCGRQGCIEAFISGPSMARDHATHTGKTLSTRAIVSAAKSGEPEATATMERYYNRLARSLATVINLLDPDVIVLGGGMSNVDGLADSARERLRGYVFSDTIATRVVRNVHGDSSGVRGAAWLWPVDSVP
jgi:fructokinase